MGRIAHVNLSTQRIDIEAISEETYRRLLGGNGLVAKILLKKVRSGIDALFIKGMDV